MELVPREPDSLSMGFLLTGMYQLFYMDHIPPHAAVHETVEAAKSSLDNARCRFLNAVLRNAMRQKPQLDKKLESAPLSARCSHPANLIQRWQKNLGREQTMALCEWNNQRPNVTLRMYRNLAKQIPPEIEDFPPHPASSENYRIVPAGTRIERLPGFKEGVFYLQDPATEMAIELLDPHPGIHLLDACAAPGGKALICADKMRNQGKIVAVDRHADRLQRMQENLERIHAPIIKLIKADASRPKTLPQQKFDRILLDVPCSNTGVLQRRPDARWRVTPERIDAMTNVQTRILEATLPLLANDGVLVYSTCSLENEENQQCVDTFLQQQPEFHVTATRVSLPPESGMDGAFAARIERKR